MMILPANGKNMLLLLLGFLIRLRKKKAQPPITRNPILHRAI
jgi:hypothetical protein